MKRLLTFSAILIFITVTAVLPVLASPADDAKTLVNKAIDYIKANGKDKSFADITSGKALIKGQLYVFVVSSDYIGLAHGGSPALVGKPIGDLKDASGRLFLKEMVDKGMKNGEGWIDYSWANPVSNKIEQKTTYVKLLDDKSIVGCGYYKEKKN